MNITNMILVTKLILFADCDYFFGLETKLFEDLTAVKAMRQLLFQRICYWLSINTEVLLADSETRRTICIVHNCLDWTQARTREEADTFFCFSIEDSRYPPRKWQCCIAP